MKIINPNEVLSTRYHRVLRLLMKGLGLWPYEKYWINCILRGLFTLSMISIVIPMVVVIVKVRTTNLFIAGRNFIGCVYVIITYVTYLSFVYHEPKLQYVFEGLSEGFKKDVGKEERAIFEFYGSKQKLITEGLTSFVYIAALIITTVPVVFGSIMDRIKPLNESRPRAFCAQFDYYFFDEQDSLYFTFGHILFVGVINIGFLAFAESSYFVTTVHVISLFDIAKLHLNKTSEFAKEKLEASNSLDDEVHKAVLRSIFVQKKAFEYFDVLQELYFVKLFVEITNGCTCLGLITILVMLNLDRFEIVLQGIVAYASYLVTIFFFNLVGQLVIDSSYRFFDAIYFCNWYNFPLKTQRLINLMLLRTKRPCTYKSIILMINLTNFCLIGRVSVSYFTFYLSTQDK